MIKAVISDLDGCLADMTMAHYLALNKALDEVCGFVLDYDEHIAEFNGLPSRKKLAKLTEQGRVKEKDHQLIFDKKQEYTKEAILKTLKPEPEKIRLFEYMKKSGLKIACCTNSIRETAELMLSVSNLLGYLDLLISNEDVISPKPDPEGYKQGFERLRVKPEEALIVEDSPVGLAAAKASGGHIWAVKGVEDVHLEGFLDRLKESFEK